MTSSLQKVDKFFFFTISISLNHEFYNEHTLIG